MESGKVQTIFPVPSGTICPDCVQVSARPGISWLCLILERTSTLWPCAPRSFPGSPSPAPTAWIVSLRCGTPAGGTSQADGPQIASSLRSQSFQQSGGLPGEHQGRQMVRREEQETHLSIWMSGGEVAQHGWQIPSSCWREVQLKQGGLEETHRRLGEVYGVLWALVHLPAA